MKCAKCGREVEAQALRCPWCEAGAENHSNECDCRHRSGGGRVCCPGCGSDNVTAVRKDFDPGCGCLGLLLFSWVGLLLGFLGGGQVEMVCGNCGTRWPAGKPHQATSGGISCGLVLLLIILLVLVLS